MEGGKKDPQPERENGPERKLISVHHDQTESEVSSTGQSKSERFC